MINLQSPFLTFSERRAPFHDGMGEENAKVSFDCVTCGSTVERNVLSALAAGTKWFRALAAGDRKVVTDAFRCSLEQVGPNTIPNARFPNGSHAYLCTADCTTCQSKYIIAIDFYEKQPARYIGVLQGVAGLAPNNSIQRTRCARR